MSECYNCGGSGECPTCYGHGKIEPGLMDIVADVVTLGMAGEDDNTCGSCNGSGECRVCHGKGEY